MEEDKTTINILVKVYIRSIHLELGPIIVKFIQID